MAGTLPHAQFSSGELACFGNEQVKAWVREGYLHPVFLKEGDSFVREGRVLLVAEGWDGSLSAVDQDDLDFPAVSLTDDDLQYWELDPYAIASGYAAVNRLVGQPEEVTRQCWYLGDETAAVGGTGYCLAFVQPDHTALAALAPLPTLLRRPIVAVALTAGQLPTAVSLQLRGLGVEAAGLDPTQPWVIDRHALVTGTFPHSSDYRSVTLNGTPLTFTKQEAAVIRVLDRARSAEHLPALSYAQIQRRAPDEITAARMVDILKKSADLRKIIRSPKRGLYALSV